MSVGILDPHTVLRHSALSKAGALTPGLRARIGGLQRPSTLRGPTNLSAALGGARMKERSSILTLGDRERETRMVPQRLSRMRKGTSWCASMGGARIKERGRIVAQGA